ncbi:hypothetical protein FJY93_00215 [Candidatus Kaiserbacteria bacterium]|nr:hypothetical protein [Candidatus Kaiserbacteria bacterium]
MKTSTRIYTQQKKGVIIAFACLTIAYLTLLPAIGLAQEQQSLPAQITSCSQNGNVPVESGNSVGVSQGSGTFVPVADQAVITNTNLMIQNTSRIIRNTGMLVYKECVLRPLVNAQRKAVTSMVVRNGINAYNTQRNGGPLFAQNIIQERLYLALDPQILVTLANGTFDALNDLFEGTIKSAVGNNYYKATREKASSTLACPYRGNLNAALNGSPQGSTRDALLAFRNPACVPHMAAEMANQVAFDYMGAAEESLLTNVNWGQGNYPQVQLDDNGNYVFTTDTIVTAPASAVKTVQEQLLTSGFRMQENANNVNEMVDVLFSDVGSRMMSSPQGMGGLVMPGTGGSSGGSYLDQVVSRSGGQLIQIGGNAALQILNAALTVERAYNQAVSAIAANLIQTINQLRAVERQCFTSLTQNVCVAGTISPDGTSCTGVSGNNLTRIATSTAFSQAVVTNQIAPLASTTQANITKSNNAITILSQMISTVTNNPNAQASVLAQYNQLAAQGTFHTQSDVTSAQAQLQTVAAATSNLVQNTINTWAGTDSQGESTIPWDHSISPGVGWCNYQSQGTLTSWDQRWR